MKATGEGGKDINTHVVYEAMVAGRVAIVMCVFHILGFSFKLILPSECMTDNGNRTIHKLREILNGHG